MHRIALTKVRQSSHYIPVVIFVFFWGFYSLTARGLISEADGIVNFMTTQSIVETASFAVSCDYPDIFIVQGVDEKCYSKYGIGWPLMSIPLYLVGRFISGPVPPNPNELSLPRLTVSTLNQFVTAATCSTLYVLGFRISSDRRRAVELTFAFGLLTIAWPYASTSFSQPVIGFLILFSIMLVGSSNRSPMRSLLAGFALGVAFLVRLDSLLLILMVFIWMMHKIKSAKTGLDKGSVLSITTISVPIFASFAVFAIAQLSHYGSLFQTGYGGEGWSSPFLTGFFGLLFSFGKGVVFYSPLILLALPGLFILYRQGVKDLALLAFLLFVSQLLAYSSWWSWMGGWSWGPRFLVPSLPLLMIGLLPWLNSRTFARKSVCCLSLVSFVVQIVGVTTDPLQYYLNHEIVENQLLYNPAFSPIWVQFQYLVSREVSLMIPSNAHGVLTQAQTMLWAAIILLLLTLSGRELIVATTRANDETLDLNSSQE
jgi:hypothetical protein